MNPAEDGNTGRPKALPQHQKNGRVDQQWRGKQQEGVRDDSALIAAADEALYLAKQKRRHRAVLRAIAS